VTPPVVTMLLLVRIVIFADTERFEFSEFNIIVTTWEI